MGEKLGGQTLEDSLYSLQEFHRIHDFESKEFDVSISVTRNGNTLFTKQVPVHVVYDNISQFMDIMWEDAGIDNFRGIKLFGRYNPNFNKFVINEDRETLEIYSTDSDKVVVISY